MQLLPLPSSQASSISPTLAGQMALPSEERAALFDFVQRLVRTPSLSTEEGGVARLIEGELTDAGITDVQTDRAGNLIAHLGDGNGPALLFDAHMDTVHPALNGWRFDPFSATLEDGVLYGMGACDAKGSLAALVYAARRLLHSGAPLHGNVILAFVVQEEPCEGCGLEVLIRQLSTAPDWVVLGEPTNLAVMRGHRGRVLFKVTVTGRSSHASSPELGTNAVTAAAHLLFGIELLSADLSADPFLGPGTIAVTHIESQSASKNAIPDSCTFTIDRRLTLGESPTRAQAQIEAIIQREGIQAQVEVMEYRANTYAGYPLHTFEAFSPWVLDEAHMLVQTAAHSIRAVTGRAAVVGPGTLSTDGVFSMSQANIPTIGLGPGDPHHAHTPLDQVRLDDVATASQAYAVLAAALLGRRD